MYQLKQLELEQKLLEQEQLLMQVKHEIAVRESEVGSNSQHMSEQTYQVSHHSHMGPSDDTNHQVSSEHQTDLEIKLLQLQMLENE